MRLRYRFVTQQVSDGYVAVAVGADSEKFRGVVRMNGTGAAIFSLLQQETDRETILAALEARYEAAPGALEQALESFLATLREQKLLVDEAP